jgi:uncharacterized protein YyaL (SSP411 family)
MLRSLGRYFKYFLITLFARKERALLFRDFYSWYISKNFLKQHYSAAEKRVALDKAIGWLLYSQQQTRDHGFASFRTTEGWTSSYPETSGYIIPTLFSYMKLTGNPGLGKNAFACADWLLSIQKPSGGWQSMYVDDRKPEVVFNTAQVIRGLLEVYGVGADKKYLDSALKACDWLCSIQEADGSWEKFAFMNSHRVYDSYVDHPLLLVYKITGNERYRETAVKNLDWIIHSRQHPNGWLEDCDNTQKHNDRPITHTIAYTIDGLLECGLLLNEERYIKAAQKTADALLALFSRQGYLNGRHDKNWQGSEYPICTGSAQLAIIWLKLYKLYKNETYLYAASGMNNLLVYIQSRGFLENADTKGALPGSFPFWGKYEPFAFPNWGTKYFADSLMLELELT